MSLPKLVATVLCSLVLSQAPALAQSPQTSPAVSAKLAVRGDMADLYVPEIRAVRRNDVMAVQADLANASDRDRVVFYRFRWLDSVGNSIGDGESWKQITLMGLALKTVKSVAPTPAAIDFRLEMNIEKK